MQYSEIQENAFGSYVVTANEFLMFTIVELIVINLSLSNCSDAYARRIFHFLYQPAVSLVFLISI